MGRTSDNFRFPRRGRRLAGAVCRSTPQLAPPRPSFLAASALLLCLALREKRAAFALPSLQMSACPPQLGQTTQPQGACHDCSWGQTLPGALLQERGPRCSNSLSGRRSMFLSWQVGLPLAALVGFLAQTMRSFDDTNAVKEFVRKFTNIEIVDEPLPPQPAVFEATVDGRWKHKDPRVKWYVKTDDVYRRILLQGGLGLGETYMEGLWETNDIEELCGEFLKLEQVEKGGSTASTQRLDLGWRALPFVFSCAVGMLKAKFLPSNTVTSSKENIEAHYDIGTKLYTQMLGPTMQYTCAYYCQPGMSLDEAQRAKMQLAARKLDLKPGMRVLELGCGFGGMAYYLATEYGVHVTGVTLSKDQWAYQKEHFAHPNVEIRLQDYRDVEGVYDRVFSIGILEHIGRQNLQTYFDKCYECLADDGIMLVHTIGWGKSGPWNPNTFMFKYIFPGAELPHMSHLTEEWSDRWHLEDWHSLGKSYARTGRAWLARLGSWEGLDEYDERFRRMWWYYLLSCCSSFERRRTKLWQLVYTKTSSSRPDDCHHIRMAPAVDLEAVRSAPVHQAAA